MIADWKMTPQLPSNFLGHVETLAFFDNLVKNIRVFLDTFPLSSYTFFSKPAGPLLQGMLTSAGLSMSREGPPP